MSEKIAGQEIETGETVEAVEEQKQQELGMESISELETALKTIKEQQIQLQEKDIELNHLKTQVENLNEELKLLKLPKTLPPSGRKLEHAKRAAGPRKKNTPTADQLVDKEASRNHSEAVVEPESPGPTDEEKVEQENKEEELNTHAEFKKKIATMGGVNIFGGFNPMAGLNNLKKTTPANPRISLAGDSASSPGKENGDEEKQEEEVLVVNDGTGEVDEDDIRNWINETVTEEFSNGILNKEKELKSVFKDGQVLCRLMNAVKKDSIAKINAGRFPFMHMENINSFLKAVDSFGVPKQNQFVCADLSEGKDMAKVLQCLLWIKNKALEI